VRGDRYVDVLEAEFLHGLGLAEGPSLAGFAEVADRPALRGPEPHRMPLRGLVASNEGRRDLGGVGQAGDGLGQGWHGADPHGTICSLV